MLLLFIIYLKNQIYFSLILNKNFLNLLIEHEYIDFDLIYYVYLYKYYYFFFKLKILYI